MNRFVGIFLFMAAFLVLSGMHTPRWKTIRWTVVGLDLKVVLHLSLRGTETTINGKRTGSKSYDEQARMLEEIRRSTLAQPGHVHATEENRMLSDSLSEFVSWNRRADTVGLATYIVCLVGSLVLFVTGLLHLLGHWLKKDTANWIQRWSLIASLVAVVIIAAMVVAFVLMVELRWSAQLVGDLSKLDPATANPPKLHRSLGYSFFLCMGGCILVPGAHFVAWWLKRWTASLASEGEA